MTQTDEAPRVLTPCCRVLLGSFALAIAGLVEALLNLRAAEGGAAGYLQVLLWPLISLAIAGAELLRTRRPGPGMALSLAAPLAAFASLGLLPTDRLEGPLFVTLITSLAGSQLSAHYAGSSRLGRLSAQALSLLGLGLAIAALLIRVGGIQLLAHDTTPTLSIVVLLALTLISAGQSLRLGTADQLIIFLLGQEPSHSDSETVIRRRRLFAFGLLAAATIALTVLGLIARGELRAALRQSESTLTAVADLKIQAISQWRRERAGDAAVLAANPTLVGWLGALSTPSPEAIRPALIENFFDLMLRHYRYAAIVAYDQDHHPVASRLTAGYSRPALSEETKTLLDQNTHLFTHGLTTDPDGSVYYDLIQPVLDATGRRVGAVLLRADPLAELHPLLMSWPTASRSTEAILAQVVNDRFVALVGTRLQPGSTPNLESLLLNDWRKKTGMFNVRDYRQLPVLALARPIPESDWVVLAKMDVSEALAPARTSALQLSLGLATMTFCAIPGIRLVWRRRQAGLLARHLASEHERHRLVQRLGVLMQNAHDGILILDKSLHIVEANSRADALYGYPRGQLAGLPVTKLLAARETEKRNAASMFNPHKGAVLEEAAHRRLDGSEFAVEISVQSIDIDGQPHTMAAIRDITDRKRQAIEIEQLGRLHRIISRVNQVMVRAKSRSDLLSDICAVLVEDGGFRIAWAGWHNPETQILDPVAAAGNSFEYIPGLHVSVRAELPEGQGPAGVAFRENRTVLCEDFLNDPSTTPWHDRARRAGFRSALVLPLRSQGRPVGVLSVNAAEAGVFSERARSLLQEAADNISFMLDVFAARLRRDAAEQALAAREEIYSSIISQAMDAIVLADPRSGRFIEFNAAAHEGLGYGQAEFARMSVADIQGEIPAEKIPDHLRVIREAGGMVFVTRHRHRDGSLRDVRVSARAVRVRGQDYIAAVWSDVTELRRLAENLRQSEETYRELFDLESDAILLIDTDQGRILQANAAAGALYGHNPADMNNLLYSSLTATTGSNDQLPGPESRARSEVVHISQQMHRRRDGSLFPVEINLRFFTRSGRVLCLAALRDITIQVAARETLERFNAELEQQVGQRPAELAARNREIQALLQSVPDTVLRLKSDGTLLYVRPARAATDLAALTPPGGPVAANLMTACSELGAQALRSGQASTAECTLNLSTEQTIAVELRADVLSEDQFVVFARDVTARKRLEAETAAMLERERQISEMKSRFISVTSHEFRTPLAVAMGSLELLQNHSDRLTPAKREEIFARINLAIRRLTEMIDDVLTLSRIETGRQTVHPSPCDLPRLLRSYLEEARLGDRDAHVFIFHSDAQTAEAVTDQSLLHHIFANLLSNAARYSPPNSTIELRLRLSSNRFTVDIDDEGIGIPEADRTRIFEPFERGSNVGTVKGTGLGLNIVRRMVDLMGGTIDVSPRHPVGTRFSVDLPIHLDSPTHVPSATAQNPDR